MARRRRRGSGRQRLTTILVVALVLVIVGVLLNGIISGATSSSSYVELVNHSFASQTNSVTEAQRVQGQQLTELLRDAPSLDRQVLALRLDALVRSTSRAAALQERAAAPGPSAGVGPAMSSVVEDRASGVAAIAAGIRGLLGLEPPTRAGLEASSSGAATLLPSSVVTARLAAAGATVAAADAKVGRLRASLAVSPGHAHLIRSVFVAEPALLSSLAMGALVSSLQSSPSLAVVHDVQLATWSISPSPLPTENLAGLVQLPPTSSIGVSVTLRSLGNVLEPKVTVSVTLTFLSGAQLGTASASGPLMAGGALNLVLPALAVTPGSAVLVKVVVVPPPGQSDTSALSSQVALAVAPSAGSAAGLG
jgi:hypothetical protein